ncbi:uncharacterized protein [Palaemon carinicauda]|uniref:uncharacterized protein n=1 Tax=Palaemon carinicauda TaxID=392227 RepID=UPI0035B58662
MNPIADALSRNMLAAIQLGLYYHGLAEAQRQDPEYQACRTSCTSFRWEDVPLDDFTTTLLCDVYCILVDCEYGFLLPCTDFIHGLSHPSHHSTALLLKTKFIWHGITKDAKDWAPTHITRTSLSGYRIDCSTRCPEAILMETARSTSSNLLHITPHQKTAYNPAGNGMVKLFHRTLKAVLMSRCKDSNWFSQLPLVFLGIKTTPKDALDISAAEMTYKTPTKHHIPTDLHSATHVFLRNDTIKSPLMHPYTDSFLSIQRNPKAFLPIIRGKEDWVCIEHLKPAYLLPDDPPTVRLSRAGRPI